MGTWGEFPVVVRDLLQGKLLGWNEEVRYPLRPAGNFGLRSPENQKSAGLARDEFFNGAGIVFRGIF
jgi:hypothetical protein